MKLLELGYTKENEDYLKINQLESFKPARVIAVHKERYIVRTEEGEFDAETVGNLRFTAESGIDFPVVGDWVAILEYDRSKAIIQKIFPRKTVLERQAVGKSGERQLIASNVDYALLVQSADNNFNINRLERYLTISHNSKIIPIIILTKIDMIEESYLINILDAIKDRIPDVQVFALSNESLIGIDKLMKVFKVGKTYCLLGSSGVGKSTLLNNISGKKIMDTAPISLNSKKGKHITSHRELIVLESGGLLIDNPGMRELGMTDVNSGLVKTFDEIFKLSGLCKYRDCNHIHEDECAVIHAMSKGDISQETYENFIKLQKEKTHFESSILERKQKDKALGKIIKEFKNKSQK